MNPDIGIPAVHSLWLAIAGRVTEETSEQTLVSAINFHWRWVRNLNVAFDEYISLIAIELLSVRGQIEQVIDERTIRRAVDRAHKQIRAQVTQYTNEQPLKDIPDSRISDQPEFDWQRIKEVLIESLNDVDLSLLYDLLSGVSTNQLAQKLGKSAAYVRNRRSRLIRKVRRILRCTGHLEQ